MHMEMLFHAGMTNARPMAVGDGMRWRFGVRLLEPRDDDA